MAAEEMVVLTARVKASTKKRLEDFCQGGIDGEKHIQENVVEIAVNRQIDYAAKIAKSLKH